MHWEIFVHDGLWRLMNNNKQRSKAEAPAKGIRIAARITGLFFKTLGTLLLILITTGIIFTCIFAIYVKTSLTTELDINLDDFFLDQTSTIYYVDKDGQLVELESLYKSVKGKWTRYEEIPDYLKYATVAIEDKRFFKHKGVDWYRTAGAFVNMFLKMKDTFGGSTLTQQLIKNVTQYDDVTVKRKLLEIFRALEFEKNYSKEEILLWYLNTCALGENCRGVGAAANEYFGKEVSELTLAECASLIGITNNPSIYNPYINKEMNKERQELILREMLELGYIDQTEYENAVRQELVFKSSEETEDTSQEAYSWYVDALIEDVIGDLMKAKNISYDMAEMLLHTAGYTIIAAIDPEIQAMVDSIYTNRDELPSGYIQSATQELQSAIVVMDPYTGDIVAMSGGIGEKKGSRILNRATMTLRPPGSTIKPIASYGPALDLGYIMPYTTFYDGADVKLNGTEWYPNNDNGKNEGLVTIRYAIQRSINTVAAQVIDMLKPEVSYYFLKNKVGVSSLVDNKDGFSDIDYAPLALGQLTNGITVRELTEAYSIFPNNGIFTEGRTYIKILDSEGNVVIDNQTKSNVAISDVTAYYMNDMLQNVVTNGTGSPARLSNMPVAGKTGGSDKWRDRWFVGYTPYYVAAVWCGYDSPETMGSSNPSTVLWKKVMSQVHENLEYKEFSRPENMKRVTVCIDTGLLATDACAADVRGNHTMSLYMEATKIPNRSCTAHVWQEVCSESYGLLTDTCPHSSAIKVGMIDPSKYPGQLLTPPYYLDAKYYYQSPENGLPPDPIEYVIGELKPCAQHYVDPRSGWYIDSNTGFLVNPNNRNLLYDPVNDKFYDRISGWEIDAKTGMLINPENGKLIDPWTGEVSNVVPDPFAPDVHQRPPTYGNNVDPPESPPPGTSPEPGDEEEPHQPYDPFDPFNPGNHENPEEPEEPGNDEHNDFPMWFNW